MKKVVPFLFSIIIAILLCSCGYTIQIVEKEQDVYSNENIEQHIKENKNQNPNSQNSINTKLEKIRIEILTADDISFYEEFEKEIYTLTEEEKTIVAKKRWILFNSFNNVQRIRLW